MSFVLGLVENQLLLARKPSFHGFQIQPRFGCLRSAAESLLRGKKTARVTLRPRFAPSAVSVGVFEHCRGISPGQRQLLVLIALRLVDQPVFFLERARNLAEGVA